MFLKVCSASDSGMNVSPESLKQLDDKLEETDGNQDSEINMDVTGSCIIRVNMSLQSYNHSSINFPCEN